MNKKIIVQWQFEGLHKWTSAPSDVHFLAYPHRHTFTCKAEIEVFHKDRELEFIKVKRKLKSFCNQGFDINHSCEMIAEDCINFLKEEYGIRKLAVEVFEDNENGARLETE